MILCFHYGDMLVQQTPLDRIDIDKSNAAVALGRNVLMQSPLVGRIVGPINQAQPYREYNLTAQGIV